MRRHGGMVLAGFHLSSGSRDARRTIIGTINAAIIEGMNSSEVRKAVAKLGIDLKLGTAAQAATLLAQDCPSWIASAKLAGIKAE